MILKTIDNISIKEIKQNFIDVGLKLKFSDIFQAYNITNLIPVIKDAILDDVLAIFGEYNFIVVDRNDDEAHADSLVDVYYIGKKDNYETLEEYHELILKHNDPCFPAYIIEPYEKPYKSKLTGSDKERRNPLKELNENNDLTINEIKKGYLNQFYNNGKSYTTTISVKGKEMTPLIQSITLEDAKTIFEGRHMIVTNYDVDPLSRKSQVDLFFIGGDIDVRLFDDIKRENPSIPLHLVTPDQGKRKQSAKELLAEQLR